MSLESLLKEKLDPEDKLQKSYTARYEGKHGFLVMSKKKLLFAEEKGFMRKTYNVLLEIPYTKVRESTVEKNQLVFEASGKKYGITPEEVSPTTIQKSFKELAKSASSK